MPSSEHYLVEASNDEAGIEILVSHWRASELDWDSDVPWMAGTMAKAVQYHQTPDEDCREFGPFVALAAGPVGVRKVLYRVLDELAGLPLTEVAKWIEEIMAEMDKLELIDPS